MNPTLSAALWITLIGMGLVFIALLLLWGLMALIVNATTRQAEAEAAGDGESEEGEAEEGRIEEAPAVQSVTAAKAAAVAVAVALSMQKGSKAQAGSARQPRLVYQPGSEPFSAWQAVLRANRLTQKSRIYSRKERGNGK